MVNPVWSNACECSVERRSLNNNLRERLSYPSQVKDVRIMLENKLLKELNAEKKWLRLNKKYSLLLT